MKNLYRIDDEKQLVVILVKYKDEVLEALIDLDDFDIVNSFPNLWFADKRKHGYYVKGRVRTNGKQNSFYLHRFITSTSKELDHINNNPLDNRRENIREVTRSENMQNLKARKSVSNERGVYLDKRDNTWYARLFLKGKYVLLGRFKDKTKAVESVKKARKQYMPFSKECLEND